MESKQKKPGVVVTFYSYKGGVGRSMALANIALILASWNRKVLIVDWDLEAPGLEMFFQPYMKMDIQNTKGIIDLLTENSIKEKKINWRDIKIPISIVDKEKNIYTPGNLDIILAGKKDDQYFAKIREFDYKYFYEKEKGGDLIESYREEWKNEYDFILIDSRTGVTDSSGVCTIQMPDVLALIFTTTEQGFTGILDVAKKSFEAQKSLPYDRFRILMLPILSRFDDIKTDLSEKWLAKIETNIGFIYDAWVDGNANRKSILKKTILPYINYASFGETLQVVEDGFDNPRSLGFAYQSIGSIIANGFQELNLFINLRDYYVKCAAEPDMLVKFISDRQTAEILQPGEKHIEKEKTFFQKHYQKFITVFSIIAILISFFALRRPFRQDPIVVETDRQRAAYNEFVSSYINSKQRGELEFNLNALGSLYALKTGFLTDALRDSLNLLKTQIEGLVAYKFINTVDSFFVAVRNDQKRISSYLADTLQSFGGSKELRGDFIQRNILDFSGKNIITNIPVDSTFRFTTDSSRYMVFVDETGNTLLDHIMMRTQAKFDGINNIDTFFLNRNFDITSYHYQNKATVDRPAISIFTCDDNKSNFDLTNRAIKRLNEFTLISKTGFFPSSDPNSPFFVTGNEIRINSDKEIATAERLKKILESELKTKFSIREVKDNSKNSISIFLCGN